jgi:hypothetical protein
LDGAKRAKQTQRRMRTATCVWQDTLTRTRTRSRRGVPMRRIHTCDRLPALTPKEAPGTPASTPCETIEGGGRHDSSDPVTQAYAPGQIQPQLNSSASIRDQPLSTSITLSRLIPRPAASHPPAGRACPAEGWRPRPAGDSLAVRRPAPERPAARAREVAAGRSCPPLRPPPAAQDKGVHSSAIVKGSEQHGQNAVDADRTALLLV